MVLGSEVVEIMKQQTCHFKLSSNCGVESASAADGTQMSLLSSLSSKVSLLAVRKHGLRDLGQSPSPPTSLTSTYQVIQQLLLIASNRMGVCLQLCVRVQILDFFPAGKALLCLQKAMLCLALKATALLFVALQVKQLR
jgi:hypothetical protein